MNSTCQKFWGIGEVLVTVDQGFSPVSDFCNMSSVTSDIIPLCLLLGMVLAFECGDLILEFLNKGSALHSLK